MLRPVFNTLALAAGVLLVVMALFLSRLYTFSPEQLAERAGEKAGQKADLCRDAALKTLNNPGDQKDFKSLYLRERIGVYLFEKDSLVYWNNSRLPFKLKPRAFADTFGTVKLEFGLYLYFKATSEDRTAVAMCLVKPEYALQNNYLRNDFEKWTGIPAGVGMSENPQALPAVMAHGKRLFALKAGEETYFYPDWSYLCYVVFILGFASILAGALGRVKKSGRVVEALLWLGLVVGLRLLMITLQWPAFFYHTDFYDVKLFGNADSYLNAYLGDILLNGLTLFFISAVFYFLPKKNEARVMYFIIAFVLILFVVNQYNQNVISLVNNSTLSFDFLNVFGVRAMVFVALASLAVFSFALYIAVRGFFSLFRGNYLKDLLLFLALMALVGTVQLFISGHRSIFENYWPLVFSFFLFISLRRDVPRVMLSLGFLILIMAVVTSRFLNATMIKNQKKDLEILSYTLSERQDAILESEFGGVSERIVADESLRFLMDVLPASQEEVIQLLRQKYFGGYFDRYNVDFSLFDKNCHPLLPVRMGVLSNQGYFEMDMIRDSDSTSVNGLYFIKNYRKNSRYVGKINLGDKNLFLLMEPKQYEELGSFPDLLLDQSRQKHEKLKNISHAVYRSRQTTSRYGAVNYPFFYQDSITLARSEPGYVHHFFHPEEDIDIIISENARKWNYLFTFNSYLLLFFSLTTYVFYLVYALLFTDQFRSSSLTRRIQAIIILLLLLAMTAVGLTSGRLIAGQFTDDNRKELEEKSRIIISELTSQFKVSQLFEDNQKELVNFKLKEYARLFNTPISLFGKEGFLYLTSEPKLYEYGLSAPLANPYAYESLKGNEASSESVNERAGSLRYLSYYTVLFDANQQLAGFINLPYFARQSDLASELSGIISALINVYVILFILSIVAGLILSGYITRPLRLIKQQIANITLGKQNEKIDWQSNDEVGRLVAEYNQMLVKLEESARLLAQSERESAWREMAKQVAHEIKNPLTPMKLNLQYLLHVMKNDPGDFREKFEQTSKGIIEQIDSLAGIATEFSNFARLPGIRLQAINLVEIIRSSSQIFENDRNVRIVNDIDVSILMVKGDHDQCLRVFNNIFKNAVQALEETPDPRIDIQARYEDEFVVISVRDNGCGIDETLKPRIFTPNFTTKTTGSGLGLAMVKNIMQGLGGDIWFESEQSKGATFYLRFVVEKPDTRQ